MATILKCSVSYFFANLNAQFHLFLSPGSFLSDAASDNKSFVELCKKHFCQAESILKEIHNLIREASRNLNLAQLDHPFSSFKPVALNATEIDNAVDVLSLTSVNRSETIDRHLDRRYKAGYEARRLPEVEEEHQGLRVDRTACQKAKTPFSLKKRKNYAPPPKQPAASTTIPPLSSPSPSMPPE